MCVDRADLCFKELLQSAHGIIGEISLSSILESVCSLFVSQGEQEVSEFLQIKIPISILVELCEYLRELLSEQMVVGHWCKEPFTDFCELMD